MKSLAAFMMKGRMQAVLVVSISALLALLVTPVGILSAGAVGLVALRQGIRDSLQVVFLSLLVLAALVGLLFGDPMLALAGLALWLPLLALGLWLRVTRSLRLAVEAAVLASMALVLAQHALLGDVNAFWQGLLSDYLKEAVSADMMPEADKAEMATALAPWMAGGLAAGWFLQLALALFLARGWQAMLFNPGGFAEEFGQLRFGFWLMILLPLLMAAGLAAESTGLAAQLSLVALSAFFIQGVALTHGLVTGAVNKSYWLIGFYFVLVVGMPASFSAVAAAGYIDGWMNIRARVRSRRQDADGE